MKGAESDPFDLARFVDAQRGVYEQALEELRRGRKESHWMWFIFPQVAGLGRSPMAVRYAIGSADEARAYLAHPLLGARLRDCTDAVLAAAATPAETIFGGVDAAKFRSSMTLFGHVAPAETPFRRALDVFSAGEADQLTLDRLDTTTTGAGPGR